MLLKGVSKKTVNILHQLFSKNNFVMSFYFTNDVSVSSRFNFVKYLLYFLHDLIATTQNLVTN